MGNPMLGYWYRLYMKQTRHEELLEHRLCLMGVRYRTQHPFLSINAFPDFYLPDHALVIEVDDPKHNEPERIKKDRERTKALAGLGIKVIRFTNQEVEQNIKGVMDSIRAAVFSSLRVDTASTPSLPKPPESTPPNKKKRGRPPKLKVAP